MTKRLGECHQCGECCKTLCVTGVLSIALSQHRSLDEVKLYYSYRNVRVAGVNPEKDLLFLELDIPCSQLDQNNSCMIHSQPEKLPFLCHNYPTEPDNIPECGYRFVSDSQLSHNQSVNISDEQ